MNGDMRWTEPEVNKLIALVKEGKTKRQIVDLLDRSSGALSRKMLDLGLHLESPFVQRWRLTEEEAQKLLEAKGFQILRLGVTGGRYQTPYDVIARKNGFTFAIDVKFWATTGNVHLRSHTLYNLRKFGTPVILAKTDKGWIWLEERPW